jgi:hypothetical protein
MGALLPGALLGVAVGLFLGRIWERWDHANRGFVTAGKNHAAAVKALGVATKLRRTVRGLLAIAIFGTATALFVIGYMSVVHT